MLGISGYAKDKSTGGGTSASATADKPGARTATVKLSTFGLTQYRSIAAADGTLHALYTDAKTYGKPHYVYYRASTDDGTTWSVPKNLSDNESGAGVG